MNVLDENIIHSQREKLRLWRIPFRQVGHEIARSGAQDPDITRLPLRLKQPTFFTRDFDFFRPQLRHPGYCLAWLHARPDKVAFYLRRFLRHRDFPTHKERLGKVVHVHGGGLEYWQHGQASPFSVEWLA